jgi:hypothetical protein
MPCCSGLVEEHLGHVIALACASEMVYNIVTQQCLFMVFRGDGVQRVQWCVKEDQSGR